MKKRPPAHLGKHGKQLWSQLVDEYEIGDSAGLAYVTTACECLDRMREAQKLIKEHGVSIKTGGDSLKTNPACKVELDSRNGFLAAMKALNIDIELSRDKAGRPVGTFGRNQKEYWWQRLNAGNGGQAGSPST